MSNARITYSNNKFYMNGAFCVNRKFYHSSPPHTHDFIEIVYILKGKGSHIIDGRRYPLSRGDAVFINYNRVHSFESASGFEYAEILIKPEFVCESLGGNENAFSLLTAKDFREFEGSVNKDNCVASFSGEERSLLESAIALMYKESESADRGGELILRSGLNILLTLLFRKLSLPMHSESGIDEKLLLYIKESCSRRLTLEELAARSFYNPAYFSRVFKSYAGMSFTEYLTACRIEKAKELLENSELSIESIIGEVGYSNRTKFFSDFSKITGLSPLKYRKSKN